MSNPVNIEGDVFTVVSFRLFRSSCLVGWMVLQAWGCKAKTGEADILNVTTITTSGCLKFAGPCVNVYIYTYYVLP